MNIQTSALIDKYKRIIKNALLYDWDPIGVAQFPEAQDEYDAYVSDLYNIVIVENRPAEDIFVYLWRLETDHMGLNGSREATERFAKVLRGIGISVDDDL